jgi:2-dehydro-3-deoxyphosphogluconate aldolase / (4S)-4-hydroxy-2-oxoglutarate aldolase
MADSLGIQLEQARLVAIVRLVDHADVLEIATTLCDAGVRFLEITVERPEGFGSIAQVVKALGTRAIVGAGTVTSTEDVAKIADMGARFIVTPNTNPGVIRSALNLEIMVLAGALSPSEVALAHQEGAHFVKLFPASLGGPQYLKALRGPFPNVKFVPTGGVTSENATSWFDAGAAALAMGSNLVPESSEREVLYENAKRAVFATAV